MNTKSILINAKILLVQAKIIWNFGELLIFKVLAVFFSSRIINMLLNDVDRKRIGLFFVSYKKRALDAGEKCESELIKINKELNEIRGEGKN